MFHKFLKYKMKNYCVLIADDKYARILFSDDWFSQNKTSTCLGCQTSCCRRRLAPSAWSTGHTLNAYWGAKKGVLESEDHQPVYAAFVLGIRQNPHWSVRPSQSMCDHRVSVSATIAHIAVTVREGMQGEHRFFGHLIVNCLKFCI